MMRVALILIVVVVVGVAAWTTACPCNHIPGFILFGHVRQVPVNDWSHLG